MEKQGIVVLKNCSEPCLICGKLTSKSHLQVEICYGCAAFYRRSINKHKKYVCKRNSNDCVLKSSSKRPLCRFCRYKKCLNLDLNIKKSKQKLQTIFDLPYKISEENDPYDVVDLFHKIHVTLKQNSNIPKNADGTNCETAYFNELITNLIQTSQTTDKWKPAHSYFIRVNFANNFSFNTAKLLSSYQSFQRLPFNEKIIIHDRFWQMLMNLRNAYLTYIFFNEESAVKRIVDDCQFYASEWHNNINVYGVNSIHKNTKLFFLPCKQKSDILMSEISKLKPTQIEFNYICLILLWSFHSLPDLSPSTHKLGEEMIEKASSKLHEYYVNTLRLTNYAARQAKLFNIAQRAEEVVHTKQEMLKALQFFNFGPNAFSFCKFETNYYVYKNT